MTIDEDEDDYERGGGGAAAESLEASGYDVTGLPWIHVLAEGSDQNALNGVPFESVLTYAKNQVSRGYV